MSDRLSQKRLQAQHRPETQAHEEKAGRHERVPNLCQVSWFIAAAVAEDGVVVSASLLVHHAPLWMFGL